MPFSRMKFVPVLRQGWILGSRDYKLIGIGSILGPLWPTITLAIRVILIGYVFAIVLNTRQDDYLPWLATGWASWLMISSSINNGAMAFDNSKRLMLSIPIILESFVVRVVTKQLLIFLQNLVVVLVVMLVYKVPVTFALLLVVPGLLISGVFLTGLGMILGPLVSKRKDFGQLISSLMSAMFFVLPIVWQPDSIKTEGANLIIGLNPLYHYLQIIRLPLMSEVPTVLNYSLAVLGAIVAVGVGALVMAKVRDKLVYWV
ncbi:ABC transporter permease [Candidatus Aquiluna sp. IMCC13023]|uniref:ABC transporter permease n=1 Tax=Candidatus Aquiluna sp. IMCC13023 TaxID=1081644 RepID=UPI00138A0BC3|nr:ABC transporter permease [Candidatus Aquiluna sp. IMCC13023]